MAKTEITRGDEMLTMELGELSTRVDAASKEFSASGSMKRLAAHDASLWKSDPKHQKVIENRLGWLRSIDWLMKKKEELLQFEKELVADGFSHAVLLGMGGSSLAPEVFRQTFGSAPKHPRFIVLDSTDPGQVLETERSIDLAKTLFIVSTKSGTTLETLSFYHYFYEKMKAQKGDKAGGNFVAITDPGTPLETEGLKLGFRRVFVNPSDIGGRFSVLSYFGMVPAAVMGIDLHVLLSRLKTEVDASLDQASSQAPPGMLLGLVISEAIKQGRDKLTLVLPSAIHSYGLWVEQLLAESLGKEGKGIVPIFGELLEAPSVYGPDRIFLSMYCGEEETETGAKLNLIRKAGHPIAHIHLADALDLGRQFFMWSLATAVAGARLGINPFDEPNVQAAKDSTKYFLDELKKNGTFPAFESHACHSLFDVRFGGSALKQMPVGADWRQFLATIGKTDYVCLCSYSPYHPDVEAMIQRVRMAMRNRLNIATMTGFGPRYLHSTGQLHKGGPNSCVMVVMTVDADEDAKIPGQFFSFGQLERAQALGDFQALDAKGRRVAHVHIKKPLRESLPELERFFLSV